MAFQLLSYAVEEITGKKFSTLVDKNLIQALNLTRTFLAPPVNDTNAVVLDAWEWDFGEEAPYVLIFYPAPYHIPSPGLHHPLPNAYYLPPFPPTPQH
jgi:CubicO group peptidase (beta-lactamase class C family)